MLLFNLRAGYQKSLGLLYCINLGLGVRCLFKLDVSCSLTPILKCCVIDKEFLADHLWVYTLLFNKCAYASFPFLRCRDRIDNLQLVAPLQWHLQWHLDHLLLKYKFLLLLEVEYIFILHFILHEYIQVICSHTSFLSSLFMFLFFPSRIWPVRKQ